MSDLQKHEYYTNRDTQEKGWQLFYDNHNKQYSTMSDGMRLSTGCVVKRCIEQYDQSRYYEFSEAIGHRGHGFERVFSEWLQEVFGVTPEREIELPWDFGVSHLDFYLTREQAEQVFGINKPVQIELKSNSDDQARTPNYEQVRRQMYAMEKLIKQNKNVSIGNAKELYGDCHWMILVVNPSTWQIKHTKGYHVTLEDSHREKLDEEWSIMERFAHMKAAEKKVILDHPHLLGECTCGCCDPLKILDELPKHLEEHAFVYDQARSEEKLAKQEKEEAKKFLASALTKLRKEREENLDTKGRYVSPAFIVTIDKRGTLRVTENKKNLSVTGTYSDV